MEELKKENQYRVASLFEGWNETMIWSYLQGYMGRAWADDIENPKSAQIITGDFCLFAGTPSIELVNHIPKDFPSDCILMIPRDDSWANLIEREYQTGCEKLTRYAIKKETDIFNAEKLQSYLKLPLEYSIRRIDEEIYHRVLVEEWSKYFCFHFQNYRDYEKSGLGFVIQRGDELVSGASSYTVYDKGIEIEIDTKPEYRRKGLALACASKLILECLDRGLYPSWDAANRQSVTMAEKLGYHFEKEYVTYAITDFI